jgi:acetyl esterase
MPLRLPVAVERAFACRLLALPPSILRHLVGEPRHSPDGLTLDLQLQTLLWLIDALKVPNLVGGPVDEARRSLDHSAPTLDVPLAPDVAAYDRSVGGAEGLLRARVYVPDSVRGAAPGLVYFHGGGWVVGSIESHDRVCRALASRAGIVVASVDYRLAPEHRFPAAADDAVAATRWIFANASSLQMDPAAIAVGGDSAGGNLTAVVCQALRKDSLRPAFQLLIYPGTDMTRSLPSHAMFTDSFFLSKAAADWYLGLYMGDTGLERDPRASPLFVDDLSGLPPALVITCGFDPLRDEGKAYADKMRAAGVEVESVCFEGQMHGVLMLGAAIRDGARMIDLAANRLGTSLARRARPRHGG